MEKYIIKPNKGEISLTNGIELFHDGNLVKIENSEITTDYIVKGYVVQQETNTLLKVNVIFDNEPDALKYIEIFTQQNPISELLLLKNSSQELYHYI